MSRDGINIALSDVLGSADAFLDRLRGMKAAMSDVAWYPHSSIAMLRTFADGAVIPAHSVLDVGAADGELSFLFAAAGASVDSLENAQTNFNKGEGLRRLNDAFGGPVSVTFVDLDYGFTLPRQYDLCLAMGIAYHLRNVPLLYITLAQHCRFMVTNTRVIDVAPDGTRTEGGPFAYLLDRREINDDPTNFWFFSPAGYRRVLKRCGWQVLREACFGPTIGSLDADKRMWALCERVPNHADLRLHHDF
jgi:tRNA (mo5U34)-methyltransferase